MSSHSKHGHGPHVADQITRRVLSPGYWEGSGHEEHADEPRQEQKCPRHTWVGVRRPSWPGQEFLLVLQDWVHRGRGSRQVEGWGPAWNFLTLAFHPWGARARQEQKRQIKAKSGWKHQAPPLLPHKQLNNVVRLLVIFVRDHFLCLTLGGAGSRGDLLTGNSLHTSL